MIAMLPNLSPDIIYAIWLKKIVDTHLTQAWDKPESERDEEENEFLNELWEQLDDKQQQRLWGLSADLNTLRDKETVVEADWEPMTEQQLRQEQSDAYARREWDRLLESLRRPPRFRPRAQVDYIRGRVWMEMGHPQVALLFFDNATRLDPSHSATRIGALKCLMAMQNWQDARDRAEQCLHDQCFGLPMLAFVANVFYSYANATRNDEYYQRAVDVIDKFLAAIEQSDQREFMQPLVCMAYAMKAQSLCHLKAFEQALSTYDEAIGRFPNDPLMLTARGILKHQLARPGALDDFRQAIHKGTPFVSPYLETARVALEQEKFQDTIHLCQLGLQRIPQSESAALLLNIMAIAIYHLGDTENADRAFARAAQLDPLNDDIQANLKTFEEHRGSQPEEHPNWEINATTSASSVDEVFQHMQPGV